MPSTKDLQVTTSIKQLQKEKFPRVYEWTDPANTDFPGHKHKGRVSFIVVKGSFTMKYLDHEVVVTAGQRHDVPIGIYHSGSTGEDGCLSVIGDEFDEEN